MADIKDGKVFDQGYKTPMFLIMIRRAIVTVAVCGVFLAWLAVRSGHRISVHETLLVSIGLLLLGAFVGMFLSWPSRMWLRIVPFIGLALFVAFRRQVNNPMAPLEAVVTVMMSLASLGFVVGIIIAVDLIVANLFKKLRTPAA